MSTKLKTLPAKFEPGFAKELDQRSNLARRLNENYAEIVDDLGGTAQISRVKLALIERFCFMQAHIELLETRIARRPKQRDELMGRWVQMCNSLVGLGRLIGLERKVHKVADLQTYLREGKAK